MRRLTVLTAVVLSGAMASAQRQLTVIVPQSPEFDQVLRRDFPGLEDVAGFAGVRERILLVCNESKYDGVAFSVWMEQPAPNARYVMSQGGMRYMHRDLASDDRLEGRIMHPGDEFLYGGFAQTTPADYAVHKAAVLRDITMTFEPQQSKEQVKYSLDAVIFADGGYMGPDRSHLLIYYRAYRNAERDLGAETVKMLDGGASATDGAAWLKHELETDEKTMNLSPTHNPQEIYRNEYLNYRFQIVQGLQWELQQSGVAALLAEAEKYMKLPAVKIVPIVDAQ